MGLFQKYPPKFCRSIVFDFSWGDCLVPREIEKNAYAKFWRDNKEYYSIFKKAYLKQLINEPTRNVILVTYPDNTICSGVCQVEISDHCSTYVFRKISSLSFVKATDTSTYI